MDALTLRNKWNEFWLSKNHTYLPESSLLADSHSTLLFNVAGMQQLIPYLSGQDHPLGDKLFNIQKCVRTIDIDEVGDSSHLTFFEMMGNWSLGSYFKKEALAWSWEFLTQVLCFDKRKLAVTVYSGSDDAPKDVDSYRYWLEVGVSEDKISYLSDNWWSPGSVGPCGPDSEIFYWVGDTDIPPVGSNVENDEDNWMEIWNNVFMEYYRDESGSLAKLKKQNVDTGMGFERMCLVLQGKETIFETDLFYGAIELLQKYTGTIYIDHKKEYRIILDHIRTSIRLVQDGLRPSNVGAGYVLRMIIRRMYYNLLLVKELSDKELDELLFNLVDFFLYFFPGKRTEILSVIGNEITQFKKTLSHGIKILQGFIEKLEGGVLLSGQQIFVLYDTYGFPIELTREIAKEYNIVLDEEGFTKALELSKEKSRQGANQMFDKGVDWSNYLQGVPQTKFCGYDELEIDSCVILKDLDINGQRVLILDKTPFYAESGGQTGDTGILILDDGSKLEIKDVKKYEGIFLHFIA